jgi:hypothetical protein
MNSTFNSVQGIVTALIMAFYFAGFVAILFV